MSVALCQAVLGNCGVRIDGRSPGAVKTGWSFRDRLGGVLTGDLSVTEDASPGEWIAPRLGGEFGAVTHVVPGGYEAYARICHPASDREGRSVSWPDPSVSHEKKWPIRIPPAPTSVIRLRAISISEQPTFTSTP